jgi:hypothetical protein
MNRVNVNAIPDVDQSPLPEQRIDNSKLLLTSDQLKLRLQNAEQYRLSKKAIIDELASRNTLQQDTRAQWVFSETHHDIHNEYALTGIIEGDIVHVIIDRTFVDNDNRRWIIDYIIAEEIIIEEHRTRVEKYAKIMRLLDAREIWIGIYALMSKKWVEWKLC